MMKKRLFIRWMVVLSIFIIPLLTVTLLAQQQILCYFAGVYDPDTGICHFGSRIRVQVNYPQDLMDEAPLIDETVRTFVKDQEQHLFDTYLDPASNYSLDITPTIYRHSDTVVSIAFLTDSYTGGAHGQTENQAFTFDLAAGKVLHLRDLFQDEVDVLAVIAPMVTEGLRAEEAEYYDPQTRGMEIYDENYEHFALDANQIYFFFPPGRMGPIPAAFFKVALPLDSLRDVLKPEYQG